MSKNLLQIPLLAIPFVLQGCVSPLAQGTGPWGIALPDTSTGEGVQNALVELPLSTPTPVEMTLWERIEELELLTPANVPLVWESDVGLNLQRTQTTSTPITMHDAVKFALVNNLDIEIATFQPAIQRQSVVAAEAAFDFVFGAGVSTRKSRIPQQVMTIGGNPLGASESVTDTFDMDGSLTRRLRGGGTITFTTDITKTESDASGFVFSPDPAWQTIGAVELSQPLLRNFGETVTLAEIRIAEISQGQAREDVIDSINIVITSTEHAYLDLGLQWKTLQVKQWLLTQGEHVAEILGARREYDTGEADYAQAVATVQQRKADVIQQQALVQTASDTLKELINSTEYALESEVVLQPVGDMKANPVSISLRQALMTALEKRPDIRKLALSISGESVNMEVADNARLPRLDLQAQMSFYGLGTSAGEGYEEVFDAEFVNHLVGLTFEVPLGNRAADANYQSSRLQRMSAIATYKRGIQQAITQVKTALRDIVTSAQLMRANRAYRVAQAENLRALQVEEETMSGLTPTFLNLKLQTQSGLASARVAEFSAIVKYNKAIASLYQAMGTTLNKHQMNVEDVGVLHLP